MGDRHRPAVGGLLAEDAHHTAPAAQPQVGNRASGLSDEVGKLGNTFKIKLDALPPAICHELAERRSNPR